MRDVAEKTDNESLGCMRIQRKWVEDEQNDHDGDGKSKTARTGSSERAVKVSRLLDKHANLPDGILADAISFHETGSS
jgi:hypothetical protein